MSWRITSKLPATIVLLALIIQNCFCFPYELDTTKYQRARELLLIGYDYLIKEDYISAVDYFKTSREMFHEIDNMNQAIISDLYLLNCYKSLTQFEQFHLLYDSITEYYSKDLIDQYHTRIIFEKIAVLYNQEYYKESLELMEVLEERQFKDSSKNILYMHQVLGMKAQCLYRIGSFTESRNCFLKSINSINTRNEYDSLLLSTAFYNISKLYADYYLLDSAQYYLSKAEKLCKNFSGENNKKIVDILIMTGAVKNMKGLPRQALFYFKSADEILVEDSRNKKNQRSILNHDIGYSYYLLQEYDSSIYYLRKAERISKKLGLNVLKGHYRSLAKLYQLIDELDSANQFYQKSLSLYKKDTIIDSHELETLIEYGNFLLNHYDSTSGARLLDSIHPDHQLANFPYSIGLKYFILRGDYYFKNKDHARAKEFFDRGMKIIEASTTFKHGFQLPLPQSVELYHKYSKLLTELVLFSEDTSLIIHNNEITHKLIRLIFQLQLMSNDFNGKIFLAEKYSELIDDLTSNWIRINDFTNGENVELLSHLLSFKKFIITQGLISDHHAKEVEEIPDELKKFERDIKSRLSAYYLNLHARVSDFSEVKAVNETQYANMAIRFDSLIRELETNYPDYYSAKYSLPLSNIESVQKTLNGDHLLLDYSLLGDSLLLLQIMKSYSYDLRTIVIDSNINGAINNIDKFMSKSSIRYCPEEVFHHYLESAHSLYGILIGDHLDIFENKHLIIIPPGKLLDFPFEILIVDNNSPINEFKQADYLLRYADISYEYSINSFLQDKEMPERMRLLSVYAGLNSVDGESFSDENLIYDISESQNLVKMLDGDAFTWNSINLDSLERLSSKYNVLHFAAHNTFVEDDPLLSNVYQSETTNVDALYAIDIMNRHLNYNFLILNGCNTGTGPFISGEGSFSTAKAFYIAGCKNQLITLNPVEDHISAQIISSFFSRLKEGHSQSQALRMAKLDYLAQASPEVAHPYYWSSFVMVGNTTDCPNQLGFNRIVVLITLLILVIIGITFILLQRKNNYF